MLRQILTAAALATALGTAQAGSIMETVETGAEVPLTGLDMPAAVGGVIKFATCDGCETHTVLTQGSTTYRVNRRTVTFEEFAAAVELAQAADDVAERSIVGLYFDAASKRLVRIALVAPIQIQ